MQRHLTATRFVAAKIRGS